MGKEIHLRSVQTNFNDKDGLAHQLGNLQEGMLKKNVGITGKRCVQNVVCFHFDQNVGAMITGLDQKLKQVEAEKNNAFKKLEVD